MLYYTSSTQLSCYFLFFSKIAKIQYYTYPLNSPKRTLAHSTRKSSTLSTRHSSTISKKCTNPQSIKRELVHFSSIKDAVTPTFIAYFYVRSSKVTLSTCHELSWSITHFQTTVTLGFLLRLFQNIVFVNSLS